MLLQYNGWPVYLFPKHMNARCPSSALRRNKDQSKVSQRPYVQWGDYLLLIPNVHSSKDRARPPSLLSTRDLGTLT